MGGKKTQIEDAEEKRGKKRNVVRLGANPEGLLRDLSGKFGIAMDGKKKEHQEESTPSNSRKGSKQSQNSSSPRRRMSVDASSIKHDLLNPAPKPLARRHSIGGPTSQSEALQLRG